MNRHFGKLGDVWKHLPLAERLEVNPPTHYWETHAGSAYYPMTELLDPVHGVTRLLSHAPKHTDLQSCCYLDTLRLNPEISPGSSTIALHALGADAHYVLCDTDPESTAALKEVARDANAQILGEDGVSAIGRICERGKIAPGDVLVTVDPLDAHERLCPSSRTPI